MRFQSILLTNLKIYFIFNEHKNIYYGITKKIILYLNVKKIAAYCRMPHMWLVNE